MIPRRAIGGIATAVTPRPGGGPDRAPEDESALEEILDGVARAVVETAPDIVTVITPRGLVRYANAAAQRVLGRQWAAGEVVDIYRLTHPDDRERVRRHVHDSFRRQGRSDPIELRMIHSDGSWRSVEAVADNLVRDPVVGGFVLTLRDVTPRREAEARASAQASRQADIADLGHWALVAEDADGLVEEALNLLVSQLGADSAHVLDVLPGGGFLVLRATRGHPGASDGVVLVPGDPTASPASLAAGLAEPVVATDLVNETRFEVPTLWSEVGCASVLEVPILAENEVLGVIGIGYRTPRQLDDDDVHFAEAVANVLAAATSRQRVQELLRTQAETDQLTGLPNRLALLERLDHLFEEAGERPLPGVLGVLDIDHFRDVNDTLGHAVGDQVLAEIADRFTGVTDQLDLVARLGGDEFALYSSVVAAGEGAEMFGKRMLAALSEPVEVGGARLGVRGSIGVAEGSPLVGTPVPDALSLLRRAEAAMYKAKRTGAGCSAWTPDLERASVAKLSLAAELAEAIDAGEIEVYFQPRIAAATGELRGLEELVRWQHQRRGLLLPDTFLPLAEQTGLMKPLTELVIERSLAAIADLGQRWPELRMGINLSASSLHDPELYELLAAGIERHGVPAKTLVLEITENAVMQDQARALESITRLAELGTGFVVDDFGTGYSSLTFLQRVPVSLVRVDRSFVSGLDHNAFARKLVRAVIGLAHSLEVGVIAEGIESASVAEVAIELGCDEMQGFHLCPPLPLAELGDWLDSRTS